MTFQIHSLKMAPFQALFSLTAEELAKRHIDQKTVDEYPGFPCRVSLQDVPVGEQVLLMNHTHLPQRTPYHSSHAIYVWEKAQEAKLRSGEIPEIIRRRLISVRAFDDNHRLIMAEVAEGDDLAPILESFFEDLNVDYIHLHNAKQGCFSAKVTRHI